MPFGVAETIALISAGMQAIEIYAKYGGSRSQFIQTLNLEYNPTVYQSVEKQILSADTNYTRLFQAAGQRVQRCIDDFADAILDDQLPNERAVLGQSATACVCKQIKLLRDFMGANIPEKLKTDWLAHDCDGYFRNLQRRANQVGGGEAVRALEGAS